MQQLYYSQENYLRGYRIVNITNNEVVRMPKDFQHFVGAIDNKIFYTDRVGFTGGDSILKMYDPVTKKSIALVQAKDHVQLLKSGNQIVLRIFTNKDFEVQYKRHYKHTSSTSISTEKSRYISLNTLEEVNAVSSDFKPIIIQYTAHSEGDTNVTYFTYTVGDIETVLWSKHLSRMLMPLF